jgi:hypothetical protein
VRVSIKSKVATLTSCIVTVLQLLGKSAWPNKGKFTKICKPLIIPQSYERTAEKIIDPMVAPAAIAKELLLNYFTNDLIKLFVTNC